MAELIALGAIDSHQEAILASSRKLEQRQRRLGSLQGIGDAALVAAAAVALWSAALLLLPSVRGGSLSDARLPLLVVLVLASFEAVMPLPGVIQKAGEMAAAGRRLFELIDSPGPGAEDPVRPAAPHRPAPGAGLGLSVRDLCFGYSPAAPLVLDGFSIAVPPGGRLAIMGPTGVGKSTLVGILMRFWDYRHGEILVSTAEGATVELRTLAGDDARSMFSVMPQSPHLFHATLRENLQIAAPAGRDLADAEVEDAIRAAQLGSLLDGLPEGMGSVVGETGRELSAGEIRRVALARALLREAPIYVLDEPTENLDEPTAEAVLAAVSARLRGRTVIVITHRERDLALADQVVRMEPPGSPDAKRGIIC